jgi:hypothetical protein
MAASQIGSTLKLIFTHKNIDSYSLIHEKYLYLLHLCHHKCISLAYSYKQRWNLHFKDLTGSRNRKLAIVL